MSVAKILIVEDEILIAEDLQFQIQNMGYQVVGMASSGPEAVQKAGDLHPDLVLMDVRLQGPMSGVEAAKIIRGKADVPIIYVTAHSSTIRSLEENARCASLAKPFSPWQLRSAISNMLNNVQNSD